MLPETRRSRKWAHSLRSLSRLKYCLDFCVDSVERSRVEVEVNPVGPERREFGKRLQPAGVALGSGVQDAEVQRFPFAYQSGRNLGARRQIEGATTTGFVLAE